MADLPTTPGTLDSWLVPAIGALVEQLYDPAKLQRVQKVVENGVAKGQTIAAGASVEGALSLGESATEIIERAIRMVEAIAAPFVARFAGHLLGVELSADDIRHAVSKERGSPVANAVIATVMAGMHPPPGELEPSSEAAENFLGMLGSLVYQSWFEGLLFEHALSEVPGQEALESTAELARDLINCLGLNRMARTALRPLVRTVIAQPLEWKVNKTYTPTLLSPASVVRQFLRGKWDWTETHEELARAGYSEARIDALLNEQQKFLSVGDVRQLEQWGQWTHDKALQHLRDQGYDEPAALLALRVEGSKRIEQLANSEAAALTSAFVDRTIDDGTFDRLLTVAVPSAPERAFMSELAHLRRDINIRHLSSGEVAAAIELKVLAFPDYRPALRREGYTEAAIDVKDLMLRARLDKEKKIEQHRVDIAAERAAEKAARDKETAIKRAQLEADRTRKRRGNPGDLERAVVRGLIPIERYVEVIAPEYDADTVDILRRAVEADRVDYIAQQQRAADALQRAAHRGLDVAQLEQGVLAGVLTLDQYRQSLTFLKFEPADADVLVRTLRAKLADRASAAAKHAAAEAAARKRSVNLSVVEQLVRRGLRTVGEYDAFLQSLGFDDADRADLEDLLRAKIADDQAAADARAAASGQVGADGLTIDQFRRAVLLGLKTEAQFDTFLTDLNVSADVHALLMAELRDDLSQADAARQRRTQGGSRVDARELPLATVARAARLGIVAVDTYEQRLARAGYSADDIAIERELLLLEIADVQAARQTQAAADQAAPASGLTLAEIARAVKAGVLTLDDYRARAVELGLGQDDVDTLTRVLGDDLAETRAAQARRTELASTLKAQNVSLAVLEDQVRQGALTLDGYFDTLVRAGLAPEDADVLWTLLADALGAGVGAGGAA
jgi:hypothetical protein